MGLPELAAREAIRDRLHAYCDGIDRRDWALLRSCFADDHRHRHGAYEGGPDEFVGFVKEVLAHVPVTHHTIGNIRIWLSDDGQSARTEARFTAWHRIAAGTHELPAVDTGGQATDWLVVGRYHDRLEWRDGQWLIVAREATHDLERHDPANIGVQPTISASSKK